MMRVSWSSFHLRAGWHVRAFYLQRKPFSSCVSYHYVAAVTHGRVVLVWYALPCRQRRLVTTLLIAGKAKYTAPSKRLVMVKVISQKIFRRIAAWHLRKYKMRGSAFFFLWNKKSKAKGITWHALKGGTKVTPERCAFSIEHLMRLHYASSIYAAIFAKICH